MEIVTVKRIQGGFAVMDHTGAILIAYKHRKNAEGFANGLVHGIFNGAEDYNLRRNAALVYLANRKNRILQPPAQLELFQN